MLLTLAQKIRLAFPLLFFLGGFVWDAITIGKQVVMTDIAIFTLYVIAAAAVLHQLAAPASLWQRWFTAMQRWPLLGQKLAQANVQDLPYWVLQFLFGSLLSALFILYFKSSSAGFAWVVTLVLGALLIANEFLEGEYRRLTLCWSMFGLCTMLFCNFALPFLLGSVHAMWFYLSTLLGATGCFWLYRRSPSNSSIWPVAVVALALMGAYRADMIPPVPLVKQAVLVGYDAEKTAEGYWITVQKSPWWQFWRLDSDHLQLAPGEKLVCFSAVFAPPGLHTHLIHDWQIKRKGEWQSVSRPGFALAGGRNGGYRGYTFKTVPASGEWRVRIQTETGQTIAIKAFHLTLLSSDAVSQARRVRVRF